MSSWSILQKTDLRNRREGYTPRGDMENRIKEQQLMLFADRTSCHEFASNQFRLLLSSFAYVLLHHLRTAHLAQTELIPAQVDRLRLTLVKIAARVRLTARRVVFHLSSNCPNQTLFRTAAICCIARGTKKNSPPPQSRKHRSG
ncbi:MAG: transposase, partial [Planctomycetaceae bacterium]|nr:transposase [Planctomycetaceae bacterium]